MGRSRPPRQPAARHCSDDFGRIYGCSVRFTELDVAGCHRDQGTLPSLLSHLVKALFTQLEHLPLLALQRLRGRRRARPRGVAAMDRPLVTGRAPDPRSPNSSDRGGRRDGVPLDERTAGRPASAPGRSRTDRAWTSTTTTRPRPTVFLEHRRCAIVEAGQDLRVLGGHHAAIAVEARRRKVAAPWRAKRFEDRVAVLEPAECRWPWNAIDRRCRPASRAERPPRSRARRLAARRQRAARRRLRQIARGATPSLRWGSRR